MPKNISSSNKWIKDWSSATLFEIARQFAITNLSSESGFEWLWFVDWSSYALLVLEFSRGEAFGEELGFVSALIFSIDD